MIEELIQQYKEINHEMIEELYIGTNTVMVDDNNNELTVDSINKTIEILKELKEKIKNIGENTEEIFENAIETNTEISKETNTEISKETLENIQDQNQMVKVNNNKKKKRNKKNKKKGNKNDEKNISFDTFKCTYMGLNMYGHRLDLKNLADALGVLGYMMIAKTDSNIKTIHQAVIILYISRLVTEEYKEISEALICIFDVKTLTNVEINKLTKSKEIFGKHFSKLNYIPYTVRHGNEFLVALSKTKSEALTNIGLTECPY